MKYIRTKDGVFELLDATYKHSIKVKRNDEELWIHENDILKEADTIEELCDDAVVFHSYFRSTQGFWDYDPFKAAKRYAISHKEELYGAIWTEWGLKYVAKMNDKGELELI